MRDFDPVDNGTFKANMKRLIDSNGTFKVNMEKLIDSIDRLNATVENLVKAIATPEPEFTEEYITLLKEDYDDEELIKDITNSHDAHLRKPIDGER